MTYARSVAAQFLSPTDTNSALLRNRKRAADGRDAVTEWFCLALPVPLLSLLLFPPMEFSSCRLTVPQGKPLKRLTPSQSPDLPLEVVRFRQAKFLAFPGQEQHRLFAGQLDNRV